MAPKRTRRWSRRSDVREPGDGVDARRVVAGAVRERRVVERGADHEVGRVRARQERRERRLGAARRGHRGHRQPAEPADEEDERHIARPAGPETSPGTGTRRPATTRRSWPASTALGAPTVRVVLAVHARQRDGTRRALQGGHPARRVRASTPPRSASRLRRPPRAPRGDVGSLRSGGAVVASVGNGWRKR